MLLDHEKGIERMIGINYFVPMHPLRKLGY